MSSLFDLTGRTALVTGAARGLGLAYAEGLAEAGAAVIINDRYLISGGQPVDVFEGALRSVLAGREA